MTTPSTGGWRWRRASSPMRVPLPVVTRSRKRDGATITPPRRLAEAQRRERVQAWDIHRIDLIDNTLCARASVRGDYTRATECALRDAIALTWGFRNRVEIQLVPLAGWWVPRGQAPIR